MLVALMYFAVVREQKNWLYDKRYVGYFIISRAVGVNVEAMDAYSWPTPGPWLEIS